MYRLITYLFFLTPLLPSFGAYDTDGVQYIYLIFLCILFLCYRLFFEKNDKLIWHWNHQLTTFFSFSLFAGISIISAKNKIESLFELTHILVYCISLLVIIQLFYLNKHFKKDLINGIILISSIEVFVILLQILELITSFKKIDPSLIEGLENNRNTTAFLLVFKLPILIYFLFSKRSFSKYLTSILLFLIFIELFYLQSRGAILALVFVIISTLVYFFINRPENYLKQTLVIITLLVGSFLIANYTNNSSYNAAKAISSLSAGTNDTSINQRIDYYKAATSQFLDSPITGLGLGNWKFKGTYFYKEKIDGYIVPKNVHNDYLEFAAEIGFFGLISFLLFTLYPLFIFINKRESKPLEFLFILSVGVYIFDSLINFPFSRPIQVTLFLIISTYLISTQITKPQSRNKLKSSGIIFLFLLSFPALYVSIKLYNSQVQQKILTIDFNRSDGKSFIPLETAEKIDYKFPNVTLSTFPISAMIARIYVQENQYDKAIELAHFANKVNPYIQYPNFLLGKIYQQKMVLDSAGYYLGKAYHNLPKNKLHQTNYLEHLVQINQKDSVLSVFNKISNNKDVFQWRLFLIHLNTNKTYEKKFNDSIFSLSLKYFPKDEVIKNNYRNHFIGIDNIRNAEEIAKIAKENFERKDFLKAAEQFEEASKIDSLKYQYFQNSALSYLELNNIDQAEKLIDHIIDKINPETGKPELIKAIISDRKGDKQLSCRYLSISSQKGDVQAKSLFNKNCLNNTIPVEKRSNNKIDNLN